MSTIFSVFDKPADYSSFKNNYGPLRQRVRAMYIGVFHRFANAKKYADENVGYFIFDEIRQSTGRSRRRLSCIWCRYPSLT